MWPFGLTQYNYIYLVHNIRKCCILIGHSMCTIFLWEQRKTGWFWIDKSIRERSFQWASTTQIQLSLLVWYKVDIIIIPLKINLFSPWYSWKIAALALNNNHSLTQSTINLKKKMVRNISYTLQICYSIRFNPNGDGPHSDR